VHSVLLEVTAQVRFESSQPTLVDAQLVHRARRIRDVIAVHGSLRL
jgi:hypothetical protein